MARAKKGKKRGEKSPKDVVSASKVWRPSRFGTWDVIGILVALVVSSWLWPMGLELLHTNALTKVIVGVISAFVFTVALWAVLRLESPQPLVRCIRWVALVSSIILLWFSLPTPFVQTVANLSKIVLLFGFSALVIYWLGDLFKAPVLKVLSVIVLLAIPFFSFLPSVDRAAVNAGNAMINTLKSCGFYMAENPALTDAKGGLSKMISSGLINITDSGSVYILQSGANPYELFTGSNWIALDKSGSMINGARVRLYGEKLQSDIGLYKVPRDLLSEDGYYPFGCWPDDLWRRNLVK